MKKTLFIITLFMMLFAVQAYAQRGRHNGQREQPRREQRYRPAPQHQPHYSSPSYSRSGHYRPAPPPQHYHPPYNNYRPYRYHNHYCGFDHWRWYSWRGYHNRYICHQYYRDRYFDNMLGYYLYGTLDAPIRLNIGNLSLSRYNGMLKIEIGNSVSYMDLYSGQTISYIVGTTTVMVTVSGGYAVIRFYDEYGNNAVYTL